MNKKALRADLLLLLTACIWGFAFTAQRVGMDFLGPFTYNGLRFLLGSVSLVPIIFIFCRKSPAKNDNNEKKEAESLKTVFGASLIAGFCLWAAASLQQLGIIWTTAGNSGFITGIYVVLVPVFGFFLNRKTGIPTWIGAVLTLIGLFFVSGAVNLSQVNKGDVLTAAGGVLWTFHVLVIDALVKKVHPIKLSCGQFAVCGLLSMAAAASGLSAGLSPDYPAEIFSPLFNFSSIADCAVPLLYGGLCSVGVAYTLQVVAQKDAPPAHAAIILCLETVVAAIGGIFLLGEQPGKWTLLGFCLMLSGMIATQWDVIIGKKKF